MINLLNILSLKPKHPVKEYGIIINTLKDTVAVKNHQTLKNNSKDVIIINDNNQPITVKKERGKTINK